MSSKGTLLAVIGALVMSCSTPNSVHCSTKITISVGDNATTDLQSYLDDVHVTVASALYSAKLSVELVTELRKRLDRQEIQCESSIEDGEAGDYQVMGYREAAAGLFYKLHQEPLDWNKARISCEKDGAKLAIVRSREEAQVLATMLHQINPLHYRGSAFIGLHKYFGDEDWVNAYGDSLANSGDFFQNSHQLFLYSKNNNCAAIDATSTCSATSCLYPIPYFCEIRKIH